MSEHSRIRGGIRRDARTGKWLVVVQFWTVAGDPSTRVEMISEKTHRSHDAALKSYREDVRPTLQKTLERAAISGVEVSQLIPDGMCLVETEAAEG